MLKMPRARHHHAHAMRIAIVYALFVLDGTSGLNDSTNAGIVCNFDTIRKRKKGIAGHHGTV